MAKKLALCLCSICREHTHTANNRQVGGVLLDRRKWKEHAARDKLQEDYLIQETVIQSTVDHGGRESSIASRPRDLIDEELPRDSRTPTVNAPVSESSLSPSSDQPVDGATVEDHMTIDDEYPMHESEPDAVISELALLEHNFEHEMRLMPAELKLVFTSPPASINQSPGNLAVSHKDSRDFLRLRSCLQAQQDDLRALPPLRHEAANRRRFKLFQKLTEAQDKLLSTERLAWERDKLLAGLYGFPHETETRGPKIYWTDHLHVSRKTFQPFILAALLVTSALHTLSGVSRVTANLVLVTFRAFLVGAFISCAKDNVPQSDISASQFGLKESQKKLLESIPRDVRTVIAHLNLEPVITRFATCPSCCKTYAPDASNPDSPYPLSCTFSETNKPPCGAPLVRKVTHAVSSRDSQPRVTHTPIRPYPYCSLVSWVGKMFGRREIEALLENSWRDSFLPAGSRCRDILQSPAIQGFRGPNGSLFSHQTDGDVHLVFGLNIDWFNPGGNKQAGKSRSIGAIYLVCLNIPPDIRFRPENICLVGIIPGPNEPSLDQINHFLRPLIDELLMLWRSGVRLSSTSLCTFGRVVRGAVIPLICDLPALRKTSGFAGHSSNHLCSFCLLHKSEINNLSRPWRTRTWQEHMDIATQWRDAQTEAERKIIFDEHGIRWSELLRLPYWDPTQYAVVDAMHNLFLGEVRHHVREVWGVDIKDKPGKTQTLHTPQEQRQWLQCVVDGLRKDSLSAVLQPRKGYLVAVAQLNNLIPRKKLTKRDYANVLFEWTKSHSIDELRVPPVLNKATGDFHLAENTHDISKFQVLTQGVIDELRRDIKMTYLPSWIERPPLNFGSSAHGKLKADHWRTLCCVSMVVTLVRLWGSPGASTGDQLLLQNFVHLAIAVDFATRRSMDRERAQLFDDNMLAYLRTLRRLFEHNLVPNHHLSLHLSTCLLLFGPVHGWWAYPFERYNGIIQRLNTNNKIDEIPLTFTRLFYIGTALRCLMASTEWPDMDEFRHLLDAFQDSYQDASRGTRVVDVLGAIPGYRTSKLSLPKLFETLDDAVLPREIYDEFVNLVNFGRASTQFASFYNGLSDTQPRLSPRVRYLAKLEYNGVIFGTRDKNIRNSFICFKHPLIPDSGILAGQISRVFLHAHMLEDGQRVVEPYFFIDKYAPLSAEHLDHDPYRKFPLLDVRLFYNRFEGFAIIRPADLLCHFAALTYTPEGIQEPCVVVRALDRS